MHTDLDKGPLLTKECMRKLQRDIEYGSSLKFRVVNANELEPEDMDKLIGGIYVKKQAENIEKVAEGIYIRKQDKNVEILSTDKVRIGNKALSTDKFRSIDLHNTVAGTQSFENLVSGYKLEEIIFGDMDTSKVVTMHSMFSSNFSLKKVSMEGIDTSNVKDMSEMFYHCDELEEIKIKGIDTSNVETMANMFAWCKNLRKVHFDIDTSNVRNMGAMFIGCEQLKDCLVTCFDTSKVENFSRMFQDCKRITTLLLGTFETTSAKTLGAMFKGCRSLTLITFDKFDPSKASGRCLEMFEDCISLESINLSNATFTRRISVCDMFKNCRSLRRVDADMTNALSLDQAFTGCNNFDINSVKK